MLDKNDQLVKIFDNEVIEIGEGNIKDSSLSWLNPDAGTRVRWIEFTDSKGVMHRIKFGGDRVTIRRCVPLEPCDNGEIEWILK
jgi:hypothetical protein